MSDHDYDAIVVGVGGMGSAATYHLAAHGTDVLGIERYDVPHAMGSSHGVTRIIRKAYHEHPEYVPLLERAYELWRDLDAGHDRDLLHTNGSIAAGPPDSEVVTGARQACETHGLDYEDHDAESLGEAFPGYDLPAGFEAVYQPEGGFLWSDQCIVAHVEAAHREGATIHAREAVTDWTSTGDGVRVETDRGEYTAEKLVVAAGAWAPKLLPDLAEFLQPLRQVLGWFQPSDPANFEPGSFPVFVVDQGNDDEAGEDDLYYGFPRYHVPGMKVGKHFHFREPVDPDAMAREPRPEDEAALRSFLAESMPDADGATMALSTCIYTATPDEEFVIDHHPTHDDVVVACGFSGHGFKFASVVGEILADLAIDDATEHPIDRFDAERF